MNLSLETLNKGKNELERLHEVRQTSLKRVISSIRSDIAKLWEEAGIESDSQKRIELPIYFQDITELEDSSVR